MLSEFLRLLGFGLCHQIPERTFVYGDVLFAVCSRDTGMYLGFVTALAMLMWVGRKSRPNELPGGFGLGLIIVLFGSMVLDGVTSYANFRETTNLIRFATGIAAGSAMSAVVSAILMDSLGMRTSGVRVLSERMHLISFIVTVLLTFVLGWWVLPLLGAGYALLSAATIVITFTVVNLGLVALIAPKRPHENDRSALRRFAFTAVVLAVVELVAVALLKGWLLG